MHPAIAAVMASASTLCIVFVVMAAALAYYNQKGPP